MARQTYGTTFWGNEFLQRIYNETDDGRLGRGKTYANTGRIYNVKLKDGEIYAKVKGNYRSYYVSGLIFEPFAKGDRELIVKYIEQNPMILAHITNGQMPEIMLDFLYENEIDLFGGFSMNCDCYDFHDDYTCKHIAALYFMLAREIDKNPLILFSLRGLDLVSYFEIKEEVEIPYPLELEFSEKKGEISQTKSIDILKLQNYKSFILSMLELNPPFSPVDYKEVLEEFYTKTTRILPQIISPLQNENIEKIQRLFQDSKISLEAEKNFSKKSFIIENALFKNDDVKSLFDGLELELKDSKINISPTELFKLFVSFEDDLGANDYTYLFYLYRVAYILVQNSGFLPAVMEDKRHINIVYKPLLSVEAIKKQVEILSTISTPLCKLDEKNLSQFSQTNFILSVVLSDFVPHLDFMHKKQKQNPPLISKSFFSGEKFSTSKFENKHIAKSIYNYFSLFDIVSSDYVFKIFINSHLEDFGFSLFVREKSSQNELILKDAFSTFSKLQIAKFLTYLDRFLPNIEDLTHKKSVVFTHAKLEEFLLKTASIISNLGVEIVLPKALQQLLKPKLSVNAKKTSKSHKSFLNLDKILQFNWRLSLGDEEISIDEFEKLLENGKRVIKFKDTFVILDPKEAKAMFQEVQKKPKLNTFELLQASLNDEIFLEKDVKKLIEDIFKPKDIKVPKTLHASLREYQKRGFMWSVNNLINGFGTILADDMGLGKTIQTIAVLLYLKENGFIKNLVLVVVPTSLLLNWELELQKFAPSLSYFSFYGSRRSMKKADIIITTYDIVRRDLEIFKKEKFDCLIIDEAQKIKNPDTNITKAIKSLKTKYKIALSGTPVENNLSELWSIFDFALPKYLKSLNDFNKNFAKDIEIQKDFAKTQKLKRITAPFMLRRLKSDKSIISDLPDKIVIDEYVSLTKQQASLYKSVVDESMKQMDESNMQGLIFKLIISLKQICNHPRNFDKTSQKDASLSGKTKLLLTLLENIIIQDEKVLIFTQYVEMAEILASIIEKELLTTPLILKGGMTKEKREETIEKFQTDTRYKIFILSLKSGGVGLNLTQANHVIHYDLWFNPAVENQATDRAFRIGQKKKVSVYRFITQNSFEEKIDKIIKSKQNLSDLSVSIGENWLKDMSKDEIREIFDPKLQ